MNGCCAASRSPKLSSQRLLPEFQAKCPLVYQRPTLEELRQRQTRPYLFGGQQRPSCKNCHSVKDRVRSFVPLPVSKPTAVHMSGFCCSPIFPSSGHAPWLQLFQCLFICAGLYEQRGLLIQSALCLQDHRAATIRKSLCVCMLCLLFAIGHTLQINLDCKA